MVKTLEPKTIEFSNLRKLNENQKLKENQRRYGSIGNNDYNEGVYMCDCDSFGGGDPPCDCNR